MKKNNEVLILIILLSLLAAGCKKEGGLYIEGKKLSFVELENDISEFYSKFASDAWNKKISVTDKTSEETDAELIKYTDLEGNVLRYEIVIYGETGKATLDYYFIKDYIYVKILSEYYTFPINASEENMPYVLYRTFQEGIIYKEDIYKLEGKSLVKSNVKDMGLRYTSLAEIEKTLK